VKRDLEHLKLLLIFHFVLAAMVALLGSVFIIHFVMGIMMVNGTFPGPRPGTPGAPPVFMGWFMLGLGAFMVLFSWTLAICLTIAGFCLSRRKAWTYCFVVACIICINVPLGTALGVCTILVLLRPKVKDLFAGKIVEGRDPEDDDDDDDDRPRARRARTTTEHDRDVVDRRPDDDRFTSEV
jgi:hypothetical protein